MRVRVREGESGGAVRKQRILRVLESRQIALEGCLWNRVFSSAGSVQNKQER